LTPGGPGGHAISASAANIFVTGDEQLTDQLKMVVARLQHLGDIGGLTAPLAAAP
jgi:hypothetical protein